MKKNYITKAIEKQFKKFNQGKLSNTDLEKSVALLLASDKTGKYVTDEIKEEYSKRLERTISVNDKTSDLKFYSTSLRLKVAGFVLGTITTGAVLTSWSCSKEEVPVEEVIEETSETVESVEPIITEEVVREKVLSSSLKFDPNDNQELVRRMANFIAGALNSGIPVKDFMTDEEIEKAKSASANNVITLEQLMDYYFVMNIEDIDPEDYARLAYKEKTAKTILENYTNVASEMSLDLLTVDYDHLIDYKEIVADKDSANSLTAFSVLAAKYNSSDSKKSVIEEARTYINTNYISDEASMYTMSANEQVYRFIAAFDVATNGVGITNDIGIILMEDGTYSCTKTTKTEVKNKSERAEEYSNMYTTISEKLEESRKYYDQDLTKVSEEELKTGVELEKEIKEKALKLGVSYVANPEFKVNAVSSKTSSKTTSKTTSNAESKTPVASNVKDDNGTPIDQREFEKYNIDSTDPNAKTNYEQSVKIATEQEYAASSEHTIKDTSGNVVVSGSDVNTADYNTGYSNGYYDGNNYITSNASGSASYVAGYNAGYSAGYADRQALDSQYNFNEKETYYEPVQNGSETITSETVTEQDYTGNTSNYGNYDTTVDYNYNNSSSSSSSSSSETVFVPVENGAEEIVGETVEEESYFEPATQNEVVEETVTVENEVNYGNRTIEVNELKKDKAKVGSDINDIQLKYLNALKDLIKESSEIIEDTENTISRSK